MVALGLFSFLVGFTARSQVPLQTGGLLPDDKSDVTVWWALSSAAKIRPDSSPPSQPSNPARIRCARNEQEDVQLVFRPAKPLEHLPFGPDP